MQAHKFSEFELLLIESDNEIGTSVLLILAWIAACDGKIDSSEHKHLADISDKSKHGHDIRPIIRMAKDRDIDSFQLASEIIKKHFHGEKANLFLEMAIGMSIADGYLMPSENHILRFLADLLGVSRQRLNEIFISVTGKGIPEPSNPSEASYWRAKNNSQHENSSKEDTSNKRSQPTKNSELIEAHAVLGIEIGVSKVEIKQAYRRLAQIHHPDRFASLGDESVAAATITFQRIQSAYKYLMKYA